MVNLDYFYGSEGEQYRFYQIPAILLEDEEYKKISDTAKLLYGILLSRLALSKKNNWIEKETNRVYILYNRNDIAQKMGKSPNTISNAMNQLLEVGLIKRKRQGQGKADMLYVMNFSSGEYKKTEIHTVRKKKRFLLLQINYIVSMKIKKKKYIQMTVTCRVFKINGQHIEKLLKNR